MRRTFSFAVNRTGDYEPLFYPNDDADAWAGELVFAHAQAPEAWRGALRGIAEYDFSHISSDIVGRIFQRLISPEERHRWGQHFTGDDIVINAFCVRRADAVILDPACGSGSFLVRAYYRKRGLDRDRLHVELLSELDGSDIAAYPTHLATLNLAAREINDERNYPRIARHDFFDARNCVWPMAHHYRHVIPSNPETLICNHRMFDVAARENIDGRVLAAIGNSTVVALWKTFYGRYTGTEGSLDEVIDVRLLEVPDPRWSSPSTNARILAAFNDLAHRPIGRLVEQDLMECHSPEKAEAIASGPLKLSGELCQDDRRALDDAVFELLGVTDPGRRRALVTRLHEEAARHFRKIRIVEIQKQQQRARTGGRRFTADDLAEDAWDAAELSDSRPLPDWLADEAEPKSKFIIPKSGAPSLMPPSDMYDRAAVYFGRGQRAARVSCQSRAQAELLSKLAALGVRGMQRLPAGEAGLSRRLSSPRCPFGESAERV